METAERSLTDTTGDTPARLTDPSGETSTSAELTRGGF